MRRVVIESPFAGEVSANLRYLRAAMRDCLQRGEAPFASHGLYTQHGVLDDRVPAERELGIAAGFVWRDVAEATVVYTDRGTSAGMTCGIADAIKKGRPIEYRTLPTWIMAALMLADQCEQDAIARGACPTGGRHGEYEFCKACDYGFPRSQDDWNGKEPEPAR